MSNKKLTVGYITTIFIVILAGVGGWALYSMLNTASGDFLSLFGITSIYAQNSIVFGAVIIIIVLLGVGVLKAFERVIGA